MLRIIDFAYGKRIASSHVKLTPVPRGSLPVKMMHSVVAYGVTVIPQNDAPTHASR